MEGEGCFSLHRRIRTDNRKLRNNAAPPVLNYKVAIAFSNSDDRLIEEVHGILDKLNVGYYIQWHGTGLKKGTLNPKGQMATAVRAVGQINIFGLRRCN